MTIKIYTIATGRLVATRTDDKLAALCVELAGGGYTEHQTRYAMALHDRLLTHGRASVGRLEIEYQPEPKVEAPYRCQYCGAPSWYDPKDQSPPPDYCHESDHGSPENS